jgi:HD domain-containing protein
VSTPAGALAPQALAFAVRCHTGQWRNDAEPYINHPLEVARLLRDAGCSEVVVAAGLLHDVVEDANVTFSDLASRFGDDVAALVRGVTDDACVASYRRRKQTLRDQVRFVGGDVALLFAAGEIAEVREWPHEVGRERARLHELPPDSRVRRYVEQHLDMRLEHHRASLTMLEHVAPGHPLVSQLAAEIEHCCGAQAPPRERETPAVRRAHEPARERQGPGMRRAPDHHRW